MKLLGKSSAAVWSSPGNTQTLVGDDLSTKRLLFFSTQSYRYALLLFEDTGNVDGYTELGVPFIGTYLSLDAYRIKRARAPVQLTQILRADRGAIQKVVRPAPKRHSIEFSLQTRSARDVIQDLDDDREHCFFSFDPAAYPGTETIYGVIEQAIPFEHALMSEDLWNSGELVFAEDLG